MANIFRVLRKFSDNFFDGMKNSMADKVIAEAEKSGIERRAIEKREREKLEKEELEKMLGSIPEPRLAGEKATTEEIMIVLKNYLESGGESVAPTIDDFIDLNNNEGLNIRIRHFTETGRGFISEYISALQSAGAKELKTPADIERVINNYIEPDDEEKLNNAKENRNLEKVAEYIQNNFKSLSKYFLSAAKLAAINQSITTSLIQQTFKIGYSRACEVMEQLESAGVISEDPEDLKYSVHLEGQEDINAILLLLKDDVQKKIIEELNKK